MTGASSSNESPIDAPSRAAQAVTPLVPAGDATLAPPPEAPEATTAAQTSTDRPRRIRTFESLIEVPALRWYLLSMAGNWSAMQMQQLTRGFLAFQLTGSYAALGGIELAAATPRIFLALTGGVVADRANRRLLLQVGQLVQAGLAAVLSTLLFLEVLRFEHLVIGAVVQGISNSFVMPSRQAMIPEIVGPARLMNAIGLNTFTMSTTRLMAPALAGVMIAAFGAQWVFATMTVLYFLAVVAMSRVPAIRATRTRPQAGGAGGGALRDVSDALRYLRAQRVLLLLLGMHMFITILVMPYQRLLPGFVAEVLSTDIDQAARRQGLLLTLTAVGALIGSLTVASLPNGFRGKLLLGSMALFGSALLVFSQLSLFWVNAAVVVVLGVGQAGRQSLQTILIQTHVSNEYRGRISSIQLLEDGIESIGIFAIAVAAGIFGVQVALAGVAVALIALAAGLWVFAPTYRNLA
ncbi:MAG: MFS transporter [Dehalococcoidia bacterium]|nr:MFS transporter [Dehalococcoidia bacterium]